MRCLGRGQRPDRHCKGCWPHVGWNLDGLDVAALSLLIGKRNGGTKGGAIGFLLLNSYKSAVNVTANPIKLQPCSCCFDVIKNWTGRAFPSLLLHKKIHIPHSDLAFVTFIYIIIFTLYGAAHINRDCRQIRRARRKLLGVL